MEYKTDGTGASRATRLADAMLLFDWSYLLLGVFPLLSDIISSKQRTDNSHNRTLFATTYLSIHASRKSPAPSPTEGRAPTGRSTITSTLAPVCTVSARRRPRDPSLDHPKNQTQTIIRQREPTTSNSL